MGAGNKLDASAFRVTDIYKTKVCPLAKVMRRELKKRGVKKLKVVYSEEEPIRPREDTSDNCKVMKLVRKIWNTRLQNADPLRAVWHLCHQWQG